MRWVWSLASTRLQFQLRELLLHPSFTIPFLAKLSNSTATSNPTLIMAMKSVYAIAKGLLALNTKDDNLLIFRPLHQLLLFLPPIKKTDTLLLQLLCVTL